MGLSLQEAPGQGDWPVPARRRTPSARPAMVVLGVAILILVLFGVTSILTGSGPPPPAAPKGAVRVPGSSLLAVSAGSVLAPIEQPGSPPANITSNLTVPQGTLAISHSGGASVSVAQYDARVELSVGASQAAVVAFYRKELPAQGWKVFSVGPAQNQPLTTEVLAQKAGDDGWYWEIGALVQPTTFPSPSSPGSETTRFSLRLFQRSDDGS